MSGTEGTLKAELRDLEVKKFKALAFDCVKRIESLTSLLVEKSRDMRDAAFRMDREAHAQLSAEYAYVEGELKDMRRMSTGVEHELIRLLSGR